MGQKLLGFQQILTTLQVQWVTQAGGVATEISKCYSQPFSRLTVTNLYCPLVRPQCLIFVGLKILVPKCWVLTTGKLLHCITVCIEFNSSFVEDADFVKMIHYNYNTIIHNGF